MNHHYSEVAVIGGGASGMIAALTAAEVPGRHVLLLERQQRIGRKLLATGTLLRLTIMEQILLLPNMRSPTFALSIPSASSPIWGS